MLMTRVKQRIIGSGVAGGVSFFHTPVYIPTLHHDGLAGKCRPFHTCYP